MVLAGFALAGFGILTYLEGSLRRELKELDLMSDTSGSDYAVELAFGLVFGLILSWSVGLAPALVYRYVIFRRPLEKMEVFWRLAPIIVFLMFAFKLTMAELSGKPPNGNPLPWIIIYYIGKWIMTRKPSEESLNLSTSNIELKTSEDDGSNRTDGERATAHPVTTAPMIEQARRDRHADQNDASRDDTAPPRKRAPSVNSASASEISLPSELEKNAEQRTSSPAPSAVGHHVSMHQHTNASKLYISAVVALVAVGGIAVAASAIISAHDCLYYQRLATNYRAGIEKLQQDWHYAGLSEDEQQAILDQHMQWKDQQKLPWWSGYPLVDPEVQKRDTLENFEKLVPRWGTRLHQQHPFAAIAISFVAFIPLVTLLAVSRWLRWVRSAEPTDSDYGRARG